jgi:hypothetical protein
MLRTKGLLSAALLAGVAGLLCGCPPPTPSRTGGQTEAEAPAPHGGTLYAPPDHKIHAELLLDKANKQATVYLLDAKVDKAVAIAAPTIQINFKEATAVPVKLEPDRQKDDPEGKASRFVGKHEQFGHDWKMDQLQISALIDDKPYVFLLDKD